MTKLSQWFDSNLAELLAEKIIKQYPQFDSQKLISQISSETKDKTYTQRIQIFAEHLYQFLPQNYNQSIKIITNILGPENPQETGMFKKFYWTLPLGKYVQNYGLDHFDLSLQAIQEITKRGTGEYAIREFIKNNPNKSLNYIQTWAKADNFHLRRLASEGLRPKLPWAPKLEIFIDNPQPVFQILEQLKTDNIAYVKRSVANNLTDYLKVNPEPTQALIKQWQQTDNPNTQWIIKHATRKIGV